MPTQITQVEDELRGITIFRIDGEVFPVDAELIGRIALEHHRETGNSIIIDLADVDFLDSETAPLLKRLEDEHGFEFIGIEIFVQNLINAAEKGRMSVADISPKPL